MTEHEPPPDLPSGKPPRARQGFARGLTALVLLAGCTSTLGVLLIRAREDARRAEDDRRDARRELEREREAAEVSARGLRQKREEAERAQGAAAKKAEEAAQQLRLVVAEAERAAVRAGRVEGFAGQLVYRLSRSAGKEGRDRAVLEEGVRFYRGLYRDTAKKPNAAGAAGSAALVLVALHLGLDQEDAAEASARQALARFGQAEKTKPKGAHRLGVAQARAALAYVLLRRKRTEDGLTQARASRDMLAALAQESEEADWHGQLALALEILGDDCKSAGQPEEALAAFAEAIKLRTRLAVRQREAAEPRLRLAALLIETAELHQACRRPAEALLAYRKALPLCQKLAEVKPPDDRSLAMVGQTCWALGNLLRAGRQPNEAREQFIQAAAAFGRLPKPAPEQVHRHALCHLSVGQLLTEEKEAALEAFERARVLLGALARGPSPRPEVLRDLAGMLLELGNLAHGAGRLEDAEKAFLEGVAACRRAPAGAEGHDQRRRQGILHYNLGNLYRDLSRRPDAEKQYRSALGVQRTLMAETPREPGLRWDLSMSCLNLGNLLQDAARYADAEKLFAECIDLLGELSKQFPQQPEYRRVRAMTQSNMGNLLSLARQAGRAEKFYLEALRTQEELYRRAPGNTFLWADLGRTQFGLANLYQAGGRLKEAEKAINAAIRHLETLARGRREDREYEQRLGVALYNRGNLLQLARRFKEARESYEKALKRQSDLYDRHTESRPIRFDLAQTHNNLAMLLADCPEEKFRNPKVALEHARKAVRLEPGGNVWNTVGLCEYRVGDWKASRDALRKAMQLRAGGDASDWYFLALALWRLGDKPEARQWLERADRWTKEKAPANEDLRRYHEEATRLIGK